MPYKSGALKGQLNASEIRTLIKAHNVLNTIKIPKGAKRDDLIKLVEGKGYSINHEKQSISRSRKKRTETITLEGAKKLTKPKQISEEEKKKRQQAKQKKAGEKAFLKKAIPAPPPVSKPSKGVKVGKPPPKPKPSKEDEVRPARKAAPPIPKAKDFVKIGGRSAGQRVDTSGSRNVAKVVKAPKKPKERVERVLTQDEKFLDFLHDVGHALGKSLTGEKNALQFTNNRKVKKVMKILEPIVENKKTSKFTKKEKEGIKDALNYYIKSVSPERKEDHKVFTEMVKNIEDNNSVSLN